MLKQILAVASAGALLLTACSSEEPEVTPSPSPSASPSGAATGAAAEPTTVAVTATDDGAGGGYAFDAPATIESGAARIEFANTGAEPHHAQIIRMNDGLTVNDFVTALQDGGEAAAFATISLPGGTGTVDPGGTAPAVGVVDLTPGQYAFVCFIPGADELPHVAKGMLQAFEVTESADPAPLPEGDAVALADYNIALPESVAGNATLSISNTSQAEPHEMNIIRLGEGATVDDVFGWFAAPEGPPPFQSAAGMQALFPGSSATLELSLDPGSYVFLCFIPSVIPENEGKSHAELGMVAQVEVT